MSIGFTLGIPQILICLIFILGLGQNAINHNKPKDGKYNFWGALVGVMINVVILKWGGFLTHTGIEQARILGKTFRVTLYPSSDDEQSGLLRLHSTYRHDLKCYSADEGRCLKTAASFLKGLLQLDGPIIPIISSMVTCDNNLLDISSDDIHEFKDRIKKQMSKILKLTKDYQKRSKCSQRKSIIC